MGRRRRTAYWVAAGGASEANEAANSNQTSISLGVSTPPVEQPTMNTRRSLRQQARKAAQSSYAESESVDIEGSEEEEEFARFTPLPTPRKKRFLKDVQSGGKSKDDMSESTAAVLNRLINKRASKPGYVVKPGRFNSHKGQAIKQARANARNAAMQQQKQAKISAAASSSANVRQAHLPHMEMPLKVEIQEGQGVVSEGPKKRGRKRKVDLPVNLSMKSETGEAVPPPVQRQQAHQRQDPDWDPGANVQRKRGRQSAATAKVNNRFPFCSLCLSKTPPSDYIINYMSCPNEYQRMKRLFSYIYKDLRFPFMPFDLERENVFDYCDLPLCDCCIQLYREIYDSYSQIETARDQLKSKIERMVYQIQLSEQNPAVAQQLSSIKNSPDGLMNKYCNFRRRFSSYRPGDSRGDVQGASLVPATIARIKVINQTPKRTAGTQTFLTAGHFPPPPPPTPAEPPKPAEPAAASKTETPGTSKSTTTSSSSSSTPVVVKKEVEVPGDTPKLSLSNPTKGNTSSSSAPKTSKNDSGEKQIPKTTPPQAKATSTPKPVNAATPKPSSAPAKPAPHASVLTIIKSPGGGGPAIIRKLPPKPSIIGQPARLLAIATPTHKTQSGGGSNAKNVTPNAKVNGSLGKTCQPAASSKSAPAKQNSSPFSAVVKDEPVDVEEIMQPTEDEPDPFFSTEGDESATQEQTGGKDTSSIDGQENNSKPNTNVFHKHKKLRVLPVPSYSSKESSNDSSDNNVASKEDKDKTTDPSDHDEKKDKTNDNVTDDDEKKEEEEDDKIVKETDSKKTQPQSPTLSTNEKQGESSKDDADPASSEPPSSSSSQKESDTT